MQRKYAITGAIMMLLSVVIGAFGAHILKPILMESIGTFETGVHYQMIHGLGIILVSLTAGIIGESRSLLWSSRFMLAGIILFSGSLYLLAITGIRWFGPITPLGGVSFIAGWFMFAKALWKK